MQSVIEQATHALQLGRFEVAKTLVATDLSATAEAVTRLPLLEILAQAQAGLQDHAAAARAWQEAYQHATDPEDKARVFEAARQAIRDQQDDSTLLQLAQNHLPHCRTPQEHATCLLAAGEALINLQRYAEARQQYLTPALDLANVAPETRLHLWHSLGLGHLAEEQFTEAAVAFRRSADLALGQHYASSAPHLAAQRTQMHNLRNAAWFYEGVIHLVYHRPEQAIQSFQELQRPLTAVGALNVALFLGFAYRLLQQPEAATRALQGLPRTTTASDVLHGPAAVVRLGIATLHDTPDAMGEPMEAVRDAPLEARHSWEPSWRALLGRELGLAFQRLSCREAALACYAEGLQAVAQRAGAWTAAEAPTAPQASALITTLATMPLDTWSAVLRGELRQLLQGLAWLLVSPDDGILADQALALALRVVSTPEQGLALWCQRGWLASMTTSPVALPALRAELQAAQAACADEVLGRVATGIMACVDGQAEQARAIFTQPLSVPLFPELHIVCQASWLLAHTQQDTLAGALTGPASALPWSTPSMLARVLEALLLTPAAASGPLPWLPVLLTHHAAPTLEAVRMLCRPGYLPPAQATALLAELHRLCADLTQPAVADQLVLLLGGNMLVERIEALLASIETHLTAPAASAPQAARQRGKQRPRREASPAEQAGADAAHALQLIQLWHNTPQALDSRVPETIVHWLRHYTHLASTMPEVVGALLGVLRQCPGAVAVIPTLLEHVAVSRRQRQALEATLAAPAEGSPPTTPTAVVWEDLQDAPLGRICQALADLQRPTGPELAETCLAHGDYLAALLFARLQLLPRALASLEACLQRQPSHPLAHYTMAHILQGQGQPTVALQHMSQAWQGLQDLALPRQMLHLLILNDLISLFETTGQPIDLAQWLVAFEDVIAAVHALPLSPEHQQRVRADEGVWALRKAHVLATTTPLAGRDVASTAAAQLAALDQALTCGIPTTRHNALHRQAELLARLYRYDAVGAGYQEIVQAWPDDQRAHQRLALFTALQQAEADPARLDALLAETLAAAVAAARQETPPPAGDTPEALLAWVQQAPVPSLAVLECVDVLSLYGEVAVQRQDWPRALQLLSPVYSLYAQPRHAYHLAVAYAGMSAQAASGPDALQASASALQHAEEALAVAPTLTQASTLVQAIEAQRQSLMTVQHQEQDRAAYRLRICQVFQQHGVPIHTVTVPHTTDDAWVTMQELADLDETSGKLVTTIHLAFNGQALGEVTAPDDADVTLYAQHQRDKQRVVDVHGIEALPWPHTAYEGQTDFALVFPERLGLNRDVLFVAYADLHALLRYARVLQYIVQDLQPAAALAAPLHEERLAAVARYLTVIPLLEQRLQILAAAAPSKAVQRQINSVCETLDTGLRPAMFQQARAFADAHAYFHAIVETMRAHLDTPPTERPNVQQHEERQPIRPARRKRRPSKDRWREGEPERRRESYIAEGS